MKKKTGKKGMVPWIAVLAAVPAVLPVFVPVQTVFAGEPAVQSGPAFMRSEEEWAALRDDRLDWDEIRGLVEEYNPEIRKERTAERRNEDRLKTAEETAGALVRAAEEYEELAYFYETEPGGQLTAANCRLQAENLREQAADNTGDGRVLRLGLEKSITAKEKEVRDLFVALHRVRQALRTRETDLAWAETQLREVRLRYSRGMTVLSEVNSAEETVRSLRDRQNSLEIAETAAYRSLIVSCGWAYNAQPVTGGLPAESSCRLTQEEKADGLAEALENSYLLREDRIRLENAQRLYGDAETAQKIRKQLEQDTVAVTESYGSAMEALRLAGSAVDDARKNLKLEQNALNLAEKQLETGAVSRYEVEQKKHACDTAADSLESAVYDLILARTAYNAVCSGLAD